MKKEKQVSPQAQSEGYEWLYALKDMLNAAPSKKRPEAKA